jgi:hypothetical protein
MRFVNCLALWVLVIAGLVAGCQKQEPATIGQGAGPGQAGDPMPASPRGPGAPAETSTNPVVIADSGDIQATLQQLTQELRDYVVRTHSVPKNFEEFVAKAQVTFPGAPDGQKYVIQGQSVALVKR